MMFAHQEVTQDATLAMTLMVGLGCGVIYCTSAPDAPPQSSKQSRNAELQRAAFWHPTQLGPHFHFPATCIRKKNCDSNVEGEEAERSLVRPSRK